MADIQNPRLLPLQLTRLLQTADDAGSTFSVVPWIVGSAAALAAGFYKTSAFCALVPLAAKAYEWLGHRIVSIDYSLRAAEVFQDEDRNGMMVRRNALELLPAAELVDDLIEIREEIAPDIDMRPLFHHGAPVAFRDTVMHVMRRIRVLGYSVSESPLVISAEGLNFVRWFYQGIPATRDAVRDALRRLSIVETPRWHFSILNDTTEVAMKLLGHFQLPRSNLEMLLDTNAHIITDIAYVIAAVCCFYLLVKLHRRFGFVVAAATGIVCGLIAYRIAAL